MRAMLAASAIAIALTSPAFAHMAPKQWLGQARQDIQKGDRNAAISAIDSAENELLTDDPSSLQSQSTRSVPFSTRAVHMMARAREDLRYGDFTDASLEIENAMVRPSLALAQ